VIHQQQSHLPPAVQTGIAQAFGSEPERAMPKTLPPDIDPGTLNFSARSAPKGSTQGVSDEAVREAMRASAMPGNLPPGNFGYGPPPAAQAGTGAGAPRRRKSRTGLWVGLSLLILLGLGGAALAAVFYQQHQPSTYAPPLVLDTPPPETTVNPLIDAGASGQVQPIPTIATVTPGRTPLPAGNPATAPTIIRTADAGAPATADAGRNTFPFPFPLPSTLPPLPSTFPPLPKTFPTAFPSVLPPGFPQFPGFPLGAATPAKRDGGK
jgi:hypothetical protein